MTNKNRIIKRDPYKNCMNAGSDNSDGRGSSVLRLIDDQDNRKRITPSIKKDNDN